MKKLIFCIFFFYLFTLSSFSQEYKDLFIHDLKQSFNNESNTFAIVVSSSMKEYYRHNDSKKDSFIFTDIPAINFNKDVGWCNCLDKTKFLCYLNGQSIFFDKAIVYTKDSLFLGTITECATKECEFHFLSKDNLYANCITPIAKVLRTIKPELIIRVYNIPDIYLYIKDNELYVLKLERDTQVYKVFKANEYIRDYIKSEDIKYIEQVKIAC